MPLVAADRRADVEHDRFAAQRRPQRRDRRPLDPRAIVWRQNFAIAISAPVLPAETAQSAAPDFTASIACHIDETRRPVRSAWLGLSVILTATLV